MSNDSSAIVQKAWNYAHVLKNAGVRLWLLRRADHLPALWLQPSASGLRPTLWVASVRCAPSLKLADEMTELGFDPPSPRLRRTGNPIPTEFQWSELSRKSGDELEWSGATSTTLPGSPEGGRGGAHQLHYRHTLENLGTEPKQICAA